jgi:flavin reductase (DIM6/NTAB) family NADH-FMN oxidoreductase RutF
MKKPWNVINLPVYSLVTHDGQTYNMNICTYVSAISMQPKLYTIAVYEKTKSLQNMLESETAVLQILHKNHSSLVKILGKKSGLLYDKLKYLHKKNLLTDWKGFKVLKNTCSLLLLYKISYQVTGDHHLFIFEVRSYQSFSDQVLTTGYLKELSVLS